MKINFRRKGFKISSIIPDNNKSIEHNRRGRPEIDNREKKVKLIKRWVKQEKSVNDRMIQDRFNKLGMQISRGTVRTIRSENGIENCVKRSKKHWLEKPQIGQIILNIIENEKPHDPYTDSRLKETLKKNHRMDLTERAVSWWRVKMRIQKRSKRRKQKRNKKIKIKKLFAK